MLMSPVVYVLTVKVGGMRVVQQKKHVGDGDAKKEPTAGEEEEEFAERSETDVCRSKHIDYMLRTQSFEFEASSRLACV